MAAGSEVRNGEDCRRKVRRDSTGLQCCVALPISW